jgi:hypothetical protein
MRYLEYGSPPQDRLVCGWGNQADSNPEDDEADFPAMGSKLNTDLGSPVS